METILFHIFRNSPLGRETLLQSMYFCNLNRSSMVIYIPEHTKFLMYFDNDVVQVDLDGSYLRYSDTAKQHALSLTRTEGLDAVFFKPRNFTATTLPDIPTDFDFMCCPRSISDLSSKISLGHIGTGVRKIIKCATFPVLIPAANFKPWKSIVVFFGGSANSIHAVSLGLRLARNTGLPLDMFTQIEKRTHETYKKRLQKAGMADQCDKHVRNWMVMGKKDFEENLFEIPHDALVVTGAYGHGVVKDILFGSKMEIIQSVLPNSIMVVGPNYSAKG